MAQVKIINDNTYVHTEHFKGDKIVIPAGGFIVMDSDDAYHFRGQYFPMVKDAGGLQKPESYKMLRVVPMDTATPTVVESALKCNACKHEGSDETDLSEHLKTHADAVVVDEQAENEMKRKRGK